MKHRSHTTWALGMAFALSTVAGPARPEEPTARPSKGPQVPVALVWGPGEAIHVALRDGRRVVAIDPRTWTIGESWSVPIRPISMVLADDGKTLLLGGTDGQVVALDVATSGEVVSERRVGRGPTRVVALPDGRAAVSSRWDPSLRVMDWRRGRVLAEHPLPFAPGALVCRPDGRVVVADTFGGLIVDLTPGTPGSERTFSLEGINVLALAISGDGKELLSVYMYQEDDVPITEANIDAGRVLSSRLGAVRLANLESEGGGNDPPDVPRQPPLRSLTLDGPVHGAADPSAFALSPDGKTVVIALAGAHQLLLNDRSQGASGRGEEDLLPLGHNQRIGVVEVGRSPVAVLVDPSGTFAVTADSMSDSLTVIRLADRARLAQLSLGPRSSRRTPVQRGEAAFLDARRSHDRWMSCASCHHDGHTNGLNFDTFGDGGFGAAKNTPSLLGVAGTRPFTWTGKFEHLADQVHLSFETSLRGPDPGPRLVEDLVAYLESLTPPPPRRPADDPAARRGDEVFRARRCQTCHEPPLYTIAATRDVGLDDSAGHRRFNPPSLLGVSWTAPYLHDGRAATLDDLLKVHSPGKTDPISSEDRDDLIAFLESL